MPGLRTLAATLTISLLLAAPAAAKKVWSTSPEKGFVDDAMAFDSSGARLAYIHTDSATFLNIIQLDTATFKERGRITIDSPRRVPKALAYTEDGARLLFLWMDGYTGKHGAMLFDATTGKRIKETGGAHNARIIAFQGKQVVIFSDEKTDKKGNKRITVALHRNTDLRRIKKGTLLIRADGTLRKPKIRHLYWEPGRLTMVGTKRGKYDRKRDIRLPDLAVRYNLVTRKQSWNYAPKQLVKWTRAVNMRPNHAENYRFLQVSDDLKTLFFVDRENNLEPVNTPVKWAHYEPKSLKINETKDGKILYFSMTIDPVNAEAVARRKADKERCDIYRLDPGPKATPLGQVLTHKRKFAWLVGAKHFAYLRKLKGFGRGGKTLELHTLK